MDWPVAFLHPVGCQDVSRAGKFVEEVIFEAEEGRGADDCGFGEDAADYFFAPTLSRVRQLVVG